MVFTLVFYYGLKWSGLIATLKQRNLFIGLWLGIGLTGAVGLSVWRGVAYFGVGFPLGMLIGLLVYLTFVAIFGKYSAPETESEAARSLTLIILIAAIVSHFLEINFGIAIVSTRTYFWIYAALLVVVGYIFPKIGIYELSEIHTVQAIGETDVDPKKTGGTGSKKKRRGRSDLVPRGGKWLEDYGNTLLSSLIIGLVLCTLIFDFVSNPRGLKSASDIIWAAFTQLPNQNYAVSFGILSMILTSWLFMAVVLVAEKSEKNVLSWWKNFGITLGLSMGIGIIYGLWQAGRLATMARNSATTMQGVMDQVSRFEGLISLFYFIVVILVLGIGVILAYPLGGNITKSKPVGAVIAPIVLLAVIFSSFYTNIRVIQADVVFKIADPFTRGGQWPAAISIYNRANALAPNEDYYYLFLGRAYLEYAKTIQDTNERDRLILEAKSELLKAQSLNPLNTDHTANLARLYSMWATYTTDEAVSQQRGEISSEYFSKALTLSRNSAMLWDEWAYLVLTVLKKPEDAYQKLNRALEIDPEYHRSYALLGEYYLQKASDTADASAKQEAYQEAIANYEKAMQLPTPLEPTVKFTYAQVLASIYAQVGQIPSAIDAYQRAIDSAPAGTQLWNIHEAMGGLYAQGGDLANALLHMQYALDQAPDDQKDRLRSIVEQLQKASKP
jgi:tetratricopeptide (TPR) repeat protein